MNIVEKRLNEIEPYGKNPRKNDEAVKYVAESIRNFGFKVPIVIDKNGVIVAGHTRYKAARQLHLETVPCLIADDLTEEQIKAFRLADNKVSEKAEWDFDLLNGELEGICDIDMSALGFEDIEVEEPGEVVDDEFEVELPEEPKSKLGQIYLLGKHRLMCGDSTKEEDVRKLAGGVEVDLLLTDPPYNVNYGNVRDVSEAVKLHRRTDGLIIKNDNMDDESFRQFLRDAFSNANSVMKPGAVFYIWHADNESYNFRGACRDIGWQIRECIIWNKNTFCMGRQDYQWKHEPCLYGWKEGASHLWASDRKQTTILNFDRPSRSELHPTMKPIPLFDYQIKNNTKGGDIVLDLFSGSGTTIMACEQNGRIAYGMEYDPRYVDTIIKRYIEFKGTDKDVFLLMEDGTKVPYSEAIE